MQGDGNEGMRECHQMVTFSFCVSGLSCSALLASLCKRWVTNVLTAFDRVY
jgi:hypothetical protein